MKTILRTLVVAVVVVLFGIMGTASASTIVLTLGDADYVGHINDGIPSSPSDELGYLQNLITLAIGASATTIGSETYDRIGSTLTPLPDPGSPSGFSDTSNIFTVNTTDPFYILGKYDAFHAGSWVWLVDANIGDTINLPSNDPALDKYGLSHYQVFGGGGTSVPEPSMLMLFGSGLLGLAFFGRKILGK